MGEKGRVTEERAEELWKRNLAALKARGSGYDYLPAIPPVPPAFTQVQLLPGPFPSLRITREEGGSLTLHSPIRAWEEGRELAGKAPIHLGRCLLVLGLGLAYHLLALLPSLKKDHHLIVVEPEPEVLWAAMVTQDLTPLFSRSQTILVVHPDPELALSHIKRHLNGETGTQTVFWGHPPSLRARPNYYDKVIKGLKRVKAGYCRPLGLKREKLRILLINPDYFLIPEVMRAFRQLGHEVHLFLFQKRRDPGEQVVRRILEEIGKLSPDLVFTVNHLGFDREGLLLGALHRLRLPSVSWYVDSPAIILNLYDGPKSELTFIFVWDPTYLPDVRAMGFERVHPLPLGTDPEIFSPERAGFTGKWFRQVAFVGNSMVGSLREKLARLPGTPEFQALYHRLCQALRSQPFRCLDTLLADEGLTDHPCLSGLAREERTDLEAALLWQATMDYRLNCLARLAEFRPVIYGDPGWRTLLGRPFSLRPEVNYYDDLPRIYATTAVNFNATSLQMKGAVNQRVFDVPAAGGFLVTDFREQLAELFHLGEEVVCYSEPGEIPDLVRFYLQRPELRQRLAAKARERVLREHTYRHRVAAMLDTIRRTW